MSECHCIEATFKQWQKHILRSLTYTHRPTYVRALTHNTNTYTHHITLHTLQLKTPLHTQINSSVFAVIAAAWLKYTAIYNTHTFTHTHSQCERNTDTNTHIRTCARTNASLHILTYSFSHHHHHIQKKNSQNGCQAIFRYQSDGSVKYFSSIANNTEKNLYLKIAKQ